MPDDPNLKPSTQTELLGNDPASRNPDGSLKDPGTPPTETVPSETPPTTETKPPEEKPDDTAETGAPEAYEFKAPEGFVIDEDLVKEVTPIFKELNLTNEQAQKLIDFNARQAKEAFDAPFNKYQEIRQGWRDEISKDTALGNGEGGLKPEVEAMMGRAIESLPQELQQPFRDALILTGAGDNPAFVRVWNHIAPMLAEGRPVRAGGPAATGQSPPGQAKTPAARLFPNLPSAMS